MSKNIYNEPMPAAQVYFSNEAISHPDVSHHHGKIWQKTGSSLTPAVEVTAAGSLQLQEEGSSSRLFKLSIFSEPLKPWPEYNPPILTCYLAFFFLSLLHMTTMWRHLCCCYITHLPSSSIHSSPRVLLPVVFFCTYWRFFMWFTCFSSVLSSQNEEFNWDHFPVGSNFSPLSLPALNPFMAKQKKGSTLSYMQPKQGSSTTFM